MGANFAVGSIFGVWPGTLIGSTGRDQVAAAYAVYGPQTVLVWARPKQGNKYLTVIVVFLKSVMSMISYALLCLQPWDLV